MDSIKVRKYTMESYEEFDVVKSYEEQVNDYYHSDDEDLKNDYKNQPSFKKMICITSLMAATFLVGFILAISNKTSPLIYEALYIIPVVLAMLLYKKEKRNKK